MARKCIFCQERPGSHEHIFPDWLNGVFPVEDTDDDLPEWARHRAGFDGVTLQTWSAAEIASLTTKLVCHECNTGWMSTLESAASPLLEPMMTGHPRKLNVEQELVVATWATKTVMAIEPSLTKHDNFSIEQCRIVRDQGRPPASVEVSVAAVEGPIPQWGSPAQGFIWN